MSDYGIYAKQKQDQVEMQFAFLIFATLAVSIQFQSSFGKQYPWLLITSWISLGLSALIAGYRIGKSVAFERLTLQSQANSVWLEPFRRAVDGHLILDHATGSYSQEEAARILADKIKVQDQIDALADVTANEIKKYARLQIAAYLAGILFNGIAATLNLLNPI